MSKPVISAFISTRNGAPFIGECIESLRRQDFIDWEAIFIDDASTDTTYAEAVAAAAGDLRLHLLRNTERVRQVGAFLQAFPLMSGRIVTMLDGDDRYYRHDALSQIVDCYRQDDQVEATSGRNIVSDGSYSPPRGYLDGDHDRWSNMDLKMCAPRSWLRSLTSRQLSEYPETLTGPDGLPWSYAGDVVLFAPALTWARRIGCTKSRVYRVNKENPESDYVHHWAEQADCAKAVIAHWQQIRSDANSLNLAMGQP